MSVPAGRFASECRAAVRKYRQRQTSSGSAKDTGGQAQARARCTADRECARATPPIMPGSTVEHRPATRQAPPSNEHCPVTRRAPPSVSFCKQQVFYKITTRPDRSLRIRYYRNCPPAAGPGPRNCLDFDLLFLEQLELLRLRAHMEH